eukprot:SAG31_NODE_1760_length_7322_cov_2.480011_4_plen_238_part_00
MVLKLAAQPDLARAPQSVPGAAALWSHHQQPCSLIASPSSSCSCGLQLRALRCRSAGANHLARNLARNTVTADHCGIRRRRRNMRWLREPGARVSPGRPLDIGKVQAPGVVRCPAGGWRLFYTAVGPGRPFDTCQGYILSAFSEDGLSFKKDDGIRLAPRPAVPWGSARLIAPAVVSAPHPTRPGAVGWRMYVESRGSAEVPTVITRYDVQCAIFKNEGQPRRLSNASDAKLSNHSQ